ncbi:YbaB/EbfC family nucleoid-associated protein [Tessaracoccus sp. OH4464_COT-324]|uniref:YbaB/EbfC family nucleoid-associated protein n=1 Tax=Tessaracoccus sp. OH4464_COT-324 TaxID=2491059 RepID=UPI00131A3A82|nr:YbaB/EbfC family nucleoid-associated protein [Tessaracoccus sp. OH4464_COT-324]
MESHEYLSDDPAGAELMRLATREFTAEALDGAVRVAATAAGEVVRIEVAPETHLAKARMAICEAVNTVLPAAREAFRAAAATNPALDPELRALLAGEQRVPDDELPEGGDSRELQREFIEEFEGAQATFDNARGRLSQVYVPSLEPQQLARLVRAVNRAIASASTGRDAQQPLSEFADQAYDSLDQTLTQVEGRLDDLLGQLDDVLASIDSALPDEPRS